MTDKTKTCVMSRMPIDIHAELKKRAAEHNMFITDYLRHLLIITKKDTK